MPGATSNRTLSTESAYRISLSDVSVANLTLDEEDVHVWHAILETNLVPKLEWLLSEDERTRAWRFRFARDRNNWIVARGLLRTILASYLDTAPDQLQFSYGEKGKPFLQRSGPGSCLKFNLAHSQQRALFAISRDRELGVDLEFIREELADETVAERFFSTTEVAALRALAPELKKEAFFNCWTRKEAYIKARGEGLSMPLNQFDVSLTPNEPVALLRNRADANEASRWSMKAIPVDEGYVAALVVAGHGCRLTTFYVGP